MLFAEWFTIFCLIFTLFLLISSALLIWASIVVSSSRNVCMFYTFKCAEYNSLSFVLGPEVADGTMADLFTSQPYLPYHVIDSTVISRGARCQRVGHSPNCLALR